MSKKTSKRTYIRRLREWAKFLRQLRASQLRMSRWVSEGDGKHKCGTVACAAGWAGVRFKRSGFRNKSHPCGMEPVFGRRRSWSAIRSFFGITRNQSEHICDFWEYDNGSATPKEVAARIDGVANEMASTGTKARTP